MDENAHPAITVITPAYNVGKYIGEAISSVVAQTFRDFEYLIVDDGSSDDTVAIVREHAKKDARIRLIEAEHGGSSRARNRGIEEAKGEFIAFLDGDDRWNVRFLERQLELLRSVGDEVGAVFCRPRIMSETGRVYLARWQRSGRYDFDDMLVQSNPTRVGSSLLMHKSVFDTAGLFDPEIWSAVDLDMWLRIQRDSGKPFFWGNGAYLVDVRVRPGAISRDYSKRFSALEKIIADYAPDMRRTPQGMAYVRAAVFAFRVGDDQTALNWAKKAKEAGSLRLLQDSYGRKVLVWSALPTVGRSCVRLGTNLTRKGVGKLVGAAGGLKR